MSYDDRQFGHYEKYVEAAERRAIEDALLNAPDRLDYSVLRMSLRADMSDDVLRLNDRGPILATVEMHKDASRKLVSYIYNLWVGARDNIEEGTQTVQYTGEGTRSTGWAYLPEGQVGDFAAKAVVALILITGFFPLGLVTVPWLAYRAYWLMQDAHPITLKIAYKGSVQAPYQKITRYIDPFIKAKIQTDKDGYPHRSHYTIRNHVFDGSSLTRYLDAKETDVK